MPKINVEPMLAHGNVEIFQAFYLSLLSSGQGWSLPADTHIFYSFFFFFFLFWRLFFMQANSRLLSVVLFTPLFFLLVVQYGARKLKSETKIPPQPTFGPVGYEYKAVFFSSFLTCFMKWDAVSEGMHIPQYYLVYLTDKKHCIRKGHMKGIT